MDFLLTHWHCVLPVLVIGVVLILMNFNKKKNDSDYR